MYVFMYVCNAMYVWSLLYVAYVMYVIQRNVAQGKVTYNVT